MRVASLGPATAEPDVLPNLGRCNLRAHDAPQKLIKYRST